MAVGAMAGVFAAAIGTVLHFAFLAMFGNVMGEIILKILRNSNFQMPDEALEQVEEALQGGMTLFVAVITFFQNLVIDALTKGADGVIICGCHLGDCHYIDGNEKAERRADAIKLMLEDFGIEQDRFGLEWISASEGPRFAQVMTEFTDKVRRMGPSPFKS